MRYHLFICRHGEAQTPSFHQADFDRDLTEKGKAQAVQAGKWLQQTGLKPDQIVCSSALRTLSTASIIANQFTINQDAILPIRDLYNASLTQLLRSLSALDKNRFVILLVGHNPGVSELIATLSGTYKGNVPTGSMHHLWFEMDNWTELEYTLAQGHEPN
ncbi:SixA phosphatase family protein [Adhaeribacter radiodurans]|uniref:Histidine phosphatase family protein n=1 Tax=Adhaeribacter radiodurans TaxID=2745197 RepID=A0A7L7L6T6_9BACT|nr:histidine phosphatase family protein [Adhaeribacter radiodurans]QMU28493.1 histidine phosphatase family protein [Adhaeribacter radiodurans]